MRTTVPEKMIQLMDAIDRCGQADPSGLVVLRKWLAEPGRLAALAVHVAQRTASRKGKTQGTPGALLDATRALLPTVYGEGKARSNPDRAALAALHGQFHEYLIAGGDAGGDVKAALRNRKLQLVQRALEVFLQPDDSLESGYQVARDHLLHEDPRLGPGLRGPSRGKLSELVGFMFEVEACEEFVG